MFDVDVDGKEKRRIWRERGNMRCKSDARAGE
jgi:hypothetical protein